MKWESVKKKIIKECKEHKKNDEYTKKFLSYSKRLFESHLPIISSPEHLSMLIGLNHQYVCNMAYGVKSFYREFSIPKKDGKKRIINEPLPDLKYVQSWILENILEKIPVSEYAKAYVKGRTLKHNARFHRSQKIVVTIDIKDFFPTVTVNDVVTIFESFGYYHDLACFLAYLCCLNNVLPQGAPTSPYLSNIRLRTLDTMISKYTSERSIRYTRYADDLTFSGDFNPHVLIRDVSGMVRAEGFTINAKKTRIARQNARQEVTGIVVNKYMQIPKYQRKDIRQQVYYIKKYGLDSHLEHIRETRANYLNHLLGKVNFAIFVNPHDTEMKGYFEYLKTLMD